MGWRGNPQVWVALLLAAALGWIVTIYQAGSMTGMTAGAGEIGSMRHAHASALVFLPAWVAMMAGMMLPAIAPVVSLVGGIGRKRRDAGERSVPRPVFVAGYLAVWTLLGVGVYLLSLAVSAAEVTAIGLRADSRVGAALVLMLGGLYEWTPLKKACLRHCRSPLGIFMKLWRDGWLGAFRLGFLHGALCLGCCWGLMLVLFAVGLMNLTAMVLLATVIFAQKVLPFGEFISKVSGAVLLLAGVGLILSH